MARYVSLAIVLMVVWLLLSGHFDGLFFALGAASVAISVWVAVRMKVVDPEGHPIQIAARLLTYFPWLFWEIIKSNIDVARRVLSPSLPISPRVFNVTASQKTAVGRTIYANSITLTPGTITTGVSGQEFQIHALRAADLETDEEQQMDVRCTRVERGRKERAS